MHHNGSSRAYIGIKPIQTSDLLLNFTLKDSKDRELRMAYKGDSLDGRIGNYSFIGMHSNVFAYLREKKSSLLTTTAQEYLLIVQVIVSLSS